MAISNVFGLVVTHTDLENIGRVDGIVEKIQGYSLIA